MPQKSHVLIALCDIGQAEYIGDSESFGTLPMTEQFAAAPEFTASELRPYSRAWYEAQRRRWARPAVGSWAFTKSPSTWSCRW